jgi:signal transduction histidine kinase
MNTIEITFYYIVLAKAVALVAITGYFIIAVLRHRFRQFGKLKSGAEILALDRERARIAADLHDDMGPLLSVVKYKLARIKTRSEKEHLLMEEVSDHLDRLMEQTRQIAKGLMPLILARQGIAHAVEEFIRNMEPECSVHISFSQHNIPDLPQQPAIHLFRIIQEIVHNTIRHAHARQLSIQLCRRQNGLMVHCADDGIGFIYNKGPNRNKGMGLSNIHSRVEALEGSLHISTGPGKGTAVTIEIPLPVKQ